MFFKSTRSTFVCYIYNISHIFEISSEFLKNFQFFLSFEKDSQIITIIAITETIKDIIMAIGRNKTKKTNIKNKTIENIKIKYKNSIIQQFLPFFKYAIPTPPTIKVAIIPGRGWPEGALSDVDTITTLKT